MGQNQVVLRTERGVFQKNKIQGFAESTLDFYRVQVFRGYRQIEKSSKQR